LDSGPSGIFPEKVHPPPLVWVAVAWWEKSPVAPTDFLSRCVEQLQMAPAGKERVIDSNNSWIHDHE